jgi:hypothetical protein
MSLLRKSDLIILGFKGDNLKTPKIWYGNATTRAGVSLDVDQSKFLGFVQDVGQVYINNVGQVFVKIAKGSPPSALDWAQFDLGQSDAPFLGELPIVRATGNSADIASTTIVTPSVNGTYFISGKTIITQAATSSSTLPPLIIGYTDGDNNTAQTEALGSSSSGNLLTTIVNGTIFFYVKAGVPITYKTSGYASSGATPMKFTAELIIETC